jgi:hypothetical protein
MKTYSATDLNEAPRKVFRAADQEGKVRINNQNYPDKIFYLTAEERGKALDEVKS